MSQQQQRAPGAGQTAASLYSGVKVSVDEIILQLPPTHRVTIAELKQNSQAMHLRIGELEAEVAFNKNRVEQLENALASKEIPEVRIVSAVRSLEELITALKAENTSNVDTIVRKTAEDIRAQDDPSFDAAFKLQQSVSRSLKPSPASYEFVDLTTMRESILNDGYIPINPVQTPLIQEYVSHIDGIRQCSKDGRFAFMFRDATKQDILRRIFDMCKSIETRLGDTNHLTLPPVAVEFDANRYKRESEEISFLRSKESTEHVSAITRCGEVFERAGREVRSLDEQYNFVSQLPLQLSDYETLLTTTHNEVENVIQNVRVINENGVNLVEGIRVQKASLQERHRTLMAAAEEKTSERNELLEQMITLLIKAREINHHIEDLYVQDGKSAMEMDICDQRIMALKKVADAEAMKQNKYLEGAKFTIFMAQKTKDMYRRLYNNMEEMMRTRHELCERTKTSSQEQLYSMAENLHDVITKRITTDNNQMRLDQQSLDAANRSLMGLVHSPQEMERAMSAIRELTSSIAGAKQRLTQSQADIQTIRQLLHRYSTLQFLKRDSNFLSMFENQEKTAKLKEKIDEMTQRVKFVSEVLVEISDPESRQEYVVTQCLEAIKQTVTDVNDLLPLKAKIEQLEEQYRTQACTRLKRHRKLIHHFTNDMDSGEDDLFSKEPSLQAHTTTLLSGLSVIISALTQDEDLMAQQNQRSAYMQMAVDGTLDVEKEGEVGGEGGTSERRVGPATGPRGKMFGGGPMGARQASVDGSVTPAERAMGGGTSAAGGGDSSSLPGVSQQPISINNLTADFLEEESVQHTFARVSDRIKLSHDNRRITKVPGGIEMSNTSALGSVGFRVATGIHKFTVRIGANCTRLLVGFADWNLPMEGYCNSLKYQGCYYLHIGNGTLWCPEQKTERKPFTFEAIGSTQGSMLSCVIDTTERTIGFIWQGVNLGVAFRNVNLARTLYPAFELYSNGSSSEFVVATSKPQGQKGGGGEDGGLAIGSADGGLGNLTARRR